MKRYIYAVHGCPKEDLLDMVEILNGNNMDKNGIPMRLITVTQSPFNPTDFITIEEYEIETDGETIPLARLDEIGAILRVGYPHPKFLEEWAEKKAKEKDKERIEKAIETLKAHGLKEEDIQKLMK